MNAATARFAPALLTTVITTILLAIAGCYYPSNVPPGYYAQPLPADSIAPEPGVPTSLVIVIQGECTEAQYQQWRSQVVDYLIDRGYITSESDLIADPDQAERIVRAIVSGDGFTLSVFNRNSQAVLPDLEDSDLLYPADPYFIWGFLYAGEIGLHRLPPRPRDYHPHPWPLHHGPPPGRPLYDRDHHWGHGGAGAPSGHYRPPPGDQHHERMPPRDDHAVNPSQPNAARTPASPGPAGSGSHGRPSEPNHPPGSDHGRPDEHGHAPPAATTGASRPVESRPGSNSNVSHGPAPRYSPPPPRATPPPRPAPAPQREASPPSSNSSPPSYSPPPSNSPPPSQPSGSDRDEHRAQN